MLWFGITDLRSITQLKQKDTHQHRARKVLQMVCCGMERIGETMQVVTQQGQPILSGVIAHEHEIRNLVSEANWNVHRKTTYCVCGHSKEDHVKPGSWRTLSVCERTNCKCEDYTPPGTELCRD